MAGERQVLLLLTHDLMANRAAEPIAAETADRQVIAVADKTGDGVFHTHELVSQGARLVAEKLAGAIRRWVGVEGTIALAEGGCHYASCRLRLSARVEMAGDSALCSER